MTSTLHDEKLRRTRARVILMETEKPPIKLKDVTPANAYMFERDASFSRARFEYLVDRRDRMQDKMRFGLLTLNGASLVALLSALGGDGHAASWVGFNPNRAFLSASVWAIGTILAGISAWIESNRFSSEAGNAFVRQLAARDLASRYEDDASIANNDKLVAALDRYRELPVVDFAYSNAAMFLQSASGIAWVCGIAVPLISALGLI